MNDISIELHGPTEFWIVAAIVWGILQPLVHGFVEAWIKNKRRKHEKGIEKS